MSAPLLLGLEIGGTKLQLGLGHGDGRILALERLAVATAPGRLPRAEDIRAQIARAIDPLLAGVEAKRSDLAAVGVGFGGPVEPDRLRVIESFQVEGWTDYPLGDWLSETLGTAAPIALHNDADTAGLGEARFGAGVGRSPIVYVTVGSGIGGGLVIDGHIYRGGGAGALEIGHLWSDPRPGPDDEARSSSHPDLREWSTVEQMASGWSIARRAQNAIVVARNQGASEPHPLLQTSPLTTEAVVLAAMEGDVIALAVLREATTALGRALAHVVTLLNPQRIILGGGVSQAPADLWLIPIRNEIRRRAFPAFVRSIEVVPAKLGVVVVVQGALALAADALSAASR